MAWILGWDLILEYAVGTVAVAISWGDYCTTLVRGFGVDLPVWRQHRLRHRRVHRVGGAARLHRHRRHGEHGCPAQHLAKAGQTIISEHTMQALDASVRYTLLEAVQVKGRTAKMQTGEVTWAPK